MHRSFPQLWRLLGVLLALSPGLYHNDARAQLCSPENRPLVVLVQATTRLQMTTRRPIKTIVNPKATLLQVNIDTADSTTLLLVGLVPGITQLELEDTEGHKEIRDVVVQADVEYLNSQIRKAVPLSNIQVIPHGPSYVILTGFVHRAEDISTAEAVARALGFTAINAIRHSGLQQVQLDVVIARVRRTKGRNFGFNFLGNARQTLFGSSVGGLINPLVPLGVPSEGFLQPTQFGQNLAILPGQSTLFGGVVGNAAGFLGFLQALEIEGVAKLLAQPRVVTLSGTPAAFLEGGEQAIPVPAGLGQVGVQFQEFGTRLSCLPVVLGNGRIHLEVEPEVSTLDAASGVVIAGATVPGRNTQRVHSTVELESGQSFVIGGLISKDSTSTANKFPVLGQLPFIGALFSTKSVTEGETELIVLVTVHLVDAQSACQVTKVLPGQETRQPDDFELFLEGILEAPRGPRNVFHGSRYVPAHMNGPSAQLFPCAGRTDGLAAQQIYGTGAIHPTQVQIQERQPVGLPVTPPAVSVPPSPTVPGMGSMPAGMAIPVPTNAGNGTNSSRNHGNGATALHNSPSSLGVQTPHTGPGAGNSGNVLPPSAILPPVSLPPIPVTPVPVAPVPVAPVSMPAVPVPAANPPVIPPPPATVGGEGASTTSTPPVTLPPVPTTPSVETPAAGLMKPTDSSVKPVGHTATLDEPLVVPAPPTPIPTADKSEAEEKQAETPVKEEQP